MTKIFRGKAALLINECQLGIIDARYAIFPGLAEQVESRGIVKQIAALAVAFRGKGLPVIHVPVIHRADFADVKPNSLINALTLKGRQMIRGARESDYVDALKPLEQDFVIERPAGLIAFNATSLDATLRRLEVQTVVLTGVSTNLAMPGNAMTAVDLGYNVVIPEDCIAGASAAVHRVIVDEQLRLVARIVTAKDVLEAVADGQE